MSTRTYWNGEPCEARVVRVVVADAPEFPAYWARPYVGQEREAVEVTYAARTFYIDNEAHEPAGAERAMLEHYGRAPKGHPAGEGWEKVTVGRGSPGWPHGSLEIERVVGDEQAG